MSERLKPDTLVELQDQYSNVYPYSPSGARGWVRGRREMAKLDPEVFIEWDKSHWRYQGEEDGWTFEHHFRVVEEPQPRLDMNEILTEAQSKLDSERCPDCGEIHDNAEQFLTTLMAAQESALGSDGYVILTLTPQRQDDQIVYTPELYAQHINETAKKMLEAQLIHLAFQIFRNDVDDRINEIEGPSE